MNKDVETRRNRCLLALSKLAAILIGIMLIVPVIPVRAVEEVTGEMSDRLRFVDLAGLVDGETTSKIEEQLREISVRQKMDIVIVTTNSLDGKTPVDYADDFYDEGGYGYFDSRDGVLFLLSMEDRDWVMSTTGKAIDTFTIEGQAYITDTITPYLSEGNYAKAFDIYADLCDGFIDQAKKGEPYGAGHLPKKYFKIIWIPIGLLVGFGIALIMSLSQKSQMKSIVKQQSASRYTKEDSINMFNSQDRYINNIVTTRIIQTNDTSGGGSNTHTSSSGTTHGGSSGKF